MKEHLNTDGKLGLAQLAVNLAAKSVINQDKNRLRPIIPRNSHRFEGLGGRGREHTRKHLLPNIRL